MSVDSCVQKSVCERKQKSEFPTTLVVKNDNDDNDLLVAAAAVANRTASLEEGGFGEAKIPRAINLPSVWPAARTRAYWLDCGMILSLSEVIPLGISI